jgi:hypothetical protein
VIGRGRAVLPCGRRGTSCGPHASAATQRTASSEEFWRTATRQMAVVNDDDAEPRYKQLQHSVAADVPGPRP